MCNHIFAINVLHGCEREEVDAKLLLEELNRIVNMQYVHNPATPDSLGRFWDWFNYYPLCGTLLLPEIQAACDMINNSRQK